ncbi:putative protein kinase RLK-Pelle-RLCK-VIIa-1 family [Helianthus annuus]|nr:putative protein kinase RLK-Pelle-RLCK-VIIa-1 family [Helianthus annuus]KAJ0596609.1 putative protein kinase RLK-Pelle-RLCK-VIIa-1 family [Helianthus annuus]KAJ0757274.1 putative protein kinase RLK-Pelle-RLCK-VIIa-1 family [Helianthus annuus]KAJ0760991.1 putative protein kinase RLK-Pelle-RLCK-VIIa-1 family [Helianthus annuus]KAJ0926368.1 putative protein kinase RLK-Pelle-RLCK-VIIa-1 family [Helianthus annuus]
MKVALGVGDSEGCTRERLRVSMVALKRLDRRLTDIEFWKEIMMLPLYKHDNIVSLLGFCDDCGEKILVCTQQKS